MPVGTIVLFAHCCGHSLQNCANDYCISAQSGILYENGKLTDVGGGLLGGVYDKIEKALGLPSVNKQIGAKTVFRVLPK